MMKNSVAPPNRASCALRVGLVSGVRLINTNRPSKDGSANAAGTRPGTQFGYAVRMS